MTKGNVKIVFIGGIGRSGTTLLDRILGQVNGFFSLGEVHYMWERSFSENQLCGCSKPFKECEFWRAVVEEAFGGFDQVDAQQILKLHRSVARIRYTPQLLFPKLRSQRFSSLLKQYVEILERLYEAIAKISGSEVLIDSSKSPAHAFILTQMPNIDLSVIHIVRDPHAVVYSWQRKKRRPEIYWKEEYMPRPSILKVTSEWILYNWLIDLLRKKASSYTLVRYEALAERPKTVVSKILEQLNVNLSDLNFFIDNNKLELKTNHTVSGNPIRFKQGEIEIQSDIEWIEKMPISKKWLVGALTYPLFIRYKRSGFFIKDESG